MERALLFAYGTLQPGCNTEAPSFTIVNTWPDAVLGELYSLGPYPALLNVGQGPDRVPGTVLEIDAAELPKLDRYEDVPNGLYRRRQVTTLAGRLVWIYEYNGELPADAVAISGWPTAQHLTNELHLPQRSST